MSDANDSKPDTSSSPPAGSPNQSDGDVPNLGPTSDPSGRDFGDSAGYGSGGSTRDYQEVVGESPVTANRLNPLDAVIPPKPKGDWNARDKGQADEGA